MKKIISLLLITVIMVSCSKKDIIPVKEKLEANIVFSVAEQINTVKYIVESSTDGKTFVELTTIKANNMTSFTYTTDVDVTNLFNNNINLIYLRVKSVDAYENINYSSIIKLYK